VSLTDTISFFRSFLIDVCLSNAPDIGGGILSWPTAHYRPFSVAIAFFAGIERTIGHHHILRTRRSNIALAATFTNPHWLAAFSRIPYIFMKVFGKTTDTVSRRGSFSSWWTTNVQCKNTCCGRRMLESYCLSGARYSSFFIMVRVTTGKIQK
jgi:hypothetical protein